MKSKSNYQKLLSVLISRSRYYWLVIQIMDYILLGVMKLLKIPYEVYQIYSFSPIIILKCHVKMPSEAFQMHSVFDSGICASLWKRSKIEHKSVKKQNNESQTLKHLNEVNLLTDCWHIIMTICCNQNFQVQKRS